MTKLIVLTVILISIGSVCFVIVNHFSQNPEVTPQPEPQPTPSKVKLNSTLWYDGIAQKHWIELYNQYSVRASNLKLKVFESEMVWNEEQEQWERVRTEKDVLLPFTLEPNETVSFFIRDYYEDFVYSYRDPEVYGYVVFVS